MCWGLPWYTLQWLHTGMVQIGTWSKLLKVPRIWLECLTIDRVNSSHDSYCCNHSEIKHAIKSERLNKLPISFHSYSHEPSITSYFNCLFQPIMARNTKKHFWICLTYLSVHNIIPLDWLPSLESQWLQFHKFPLVLQHSRLNSNIEY